MALYSRFYGLLLYVWYALFRPEFFVWFDLTPYRISLLLGILFVIPCLLFGTFPNVSHPLSVGSILFLFVGLVSLIDPFDAVVGWYWMDTLTRLFLVCLLAITIIDTRQKLLITVAVMAGSFGFHSAKAGLASSLSSGVQYAEGFAGSFGDNNGYAFGIGLIIPLFIAVAQNVPYRWMRWGFYLAAPLSAMTVVSLFSRGGLLGMAAASVALVVLQRRRFLAIGVLASIALGGLYFAPIPEEWFKRIETIQTYEEDQERSAVSRLHFWRVAIDMARDRPWGVGLKNYEAAYNDYDTSDGLYGSARAVHSSHFQVLAEMGFLGAAIYVWLIGYAFMLAFRLRRRSRDPRLSASDARFVLTMSNGFIASMVGFLVGGAFISVAFNDLTWMSFALLAALDRLSLRMCVEASAVPVEQPAFVGAARDGRKPLQPQPAFTLSPRR
jgi:putative inorganic carbon (HCO3(-)) transporter